MRYDFSVLMEEAKRESEKSTCKHRVACLLVDEKSNIISKGHNYHSERSKRLGKRTIHAEYDSIRGVRKPSHNLVAFIYRYGKSEYGNPIHSCACCEELLRAYGITKIISMNEYKLGD